MGDGSSGNVQVTNAFGTAEMPDFVFYPAPVITSFTPVTAAQGETVTITGFNFLHSINNSAISAVKFGGNNAFFTIIDSFTIEAKLSDGATGAVTVESNRGNASIPGFTFIPAPVISSVYPLIIGPGSEVTITGLHFTPATTVKFGDTPASSFTVVSADTIKAIVGAGATGYITIITPKYTVTRGPWVEYSTSPLIYAISPTAGPVGTTVTISGINFQPGIADNNVYFGGVKASILTATANTITVSVPAGAAYKPVSVISPLTRLTAMSNDRFNVTFPVDTAAFNDSSFAGSMDLATGDKPGSLKHADIDGDGKLDIVFINHESTFISVYRNLSVAGRLSFSPRTDIEIGMKARAMAIADMDVDGKLDLIISNNDGPSKIFIFSNQSTIGNIAFVNKYSMAIRYHAGFIETGDFDQDGRLDIVYTCTYCGAPGSINVCRNTGSNENISFAEQAYTYSGFGHTPTGIIAGLAVTDFNHDGKPDLILGMSLSSSLYYFKNTTQTGSFIFFDIKHSDEYYTAGAPTGTPFAATFSSKEYPDLVAGYFVLKTGQVLIRMNYGIL